MQASTSDSPEDADIDLKLLARRLAMEGMPVQAVIASEAGVSQSTVSRAMHGRIKGLSKGVRRLWRYAASRVELLAGAPSDNAIDASASKSPATSSKMRRRAPRKPRWRSDVERADLSLKEQRRLADAAVAGLREYLQDAFDPQLVIDQLAVLRRAQGHARRVRPAKKHELRQGRKGFA